MPSVSEGMRRKILNDLKQYYFAIDPVCRRQPQTTYTRDDSNPKPFLGIPNTTKEMSTDPKFDSLHKQLFEEGLKVRRAVVGDA
jgi:hypothetical protein